MKDLRTNLTSLCF